MICCKDTLDLDFILTLYIVSKCSNQGQEAAHENTVGRGWRVMWVYAGLDEREGGEKAAALHTVEGGGGEVEG
jgi:hypothetical protein